MNVTRVLIIVLSICKVNMTIHEIKKYVQGEVVILKCNLNTPNHKIVWFFGNTVIWNGYILNKSKNKSSRYTITQERNLRIHNASIFDEGNYTCLLTPPKKDGKYSITLESKPIEEKTNSKTSHSPYSDGKPIEEKTNSKTSHSPYSYEVSRKQVVTSSSCLGFGSGEWIVYSLVSVSILSAILISLLCILVYKYRNSRYNHSDIHTIASVSVELHDTPHVNNIMDEYRVDVNIHDNDEDEEIESEGTDNSNQSDTDIIQYEEPEYLHPYHSLVTVIDTERHTYQQINVQNKNAYVYDNAGGRTDPICTHPLSGSRTLSNIGCVREGLKRTDVYDNVYNTHYENVDSATTKHTEQLDLNNEFVLIRSNITNVTSNVHQIEDNISLD